VAGLGAGGLIVGVAAAAIAVPDTDQVSPHVVSPAPANAERAIRRNHRRGPAMRSLRRSPFVPGSLLTRSRPLLASLSSPIVDSLLLGTRRGRARGSQ
jgi:hypothetical protein